MKRVGILYHPLIKAAYALARELEKSINSRNLPVWICSAWEEEQAKAEIQSTDLILTTGGDGTILRAAQIALITQTPIVGINLGKLGFMTELSAGEAIDKLPDLLSGDCWIDERVMLEVTLSSVEGSNEAPRTFYALNDVVVARGAIARIIDIEASIDGELMTNYKADGVILATATGSTGYSLSAGGPILHPQAKEIVLLPILPHLSLAYSMVLPSTAVVKLRVNTYHQATLGVDGHINLPLSTGFLVMVKHSSSRIRFLRIHPRESFYGSLEKKLRGKRVK